ncbi:hypothetical protein [Microvirga sp. CF3016]|uniref:hypothetical protein n=1 Tax=Microvirga sp. CF3016 TaxID=3110181 RepID=UPI002E76CA82|nr:hypothetical protein [Microvirga sp. CF3016]MEE1610975.1 hypothetical protein [Microvirga sp. CF3016]
MIEALLSEWQLRFAGMQNNWSQDALNLRLMLHKLKLASDSDQKARNYKKKEHP